MTIIKELNTLIRANTVADKTLDVYNAMVDESDAVISGILQEDQLHLTERGAAIIAALVGAEFDC